MELTKPDPPRTYKVGTADAITIKDCASIELKPKEQVTFVTEQGSEYDVARTEFGYYATPSLNSRLCKQGLRALLVKNQIGRFYILLVEDGKEDVLNQYLEREQIKIICWMDSDEALCDIENRLGKAISGK